MSGGLPLGTRVRFNARSPWPERVGAEGVVVEPPDPHRYPAGKRPARSVLVLLDDDPIHRGRAATAFSDGEGDDRKRGWTCVVNSFALDVIDSEKQT